MNKSKKIEKIVILRSAAVLLAVILIFEGLLHGGALAVFQKASRICLECIGIG